MPDTQDFVQRPVDIQQNLRESQIDLLNRQIRRFHPVLNQRQLFLSHGVHIAGIVNSVPSGPAGNLQHLGYG